MKRYYKKSEILREMWKNPKDIRLLARMIARWEIIEEWGKWRFTNDHETDSWQKVDIDIDSIVDKKLSLLVQEYKDRIRELEEELKKKSAAVATPSSSNNDLLDHLALMYTYVEQKNEFINKVVKSYYDKFSGQYDWDWAVEKVYKMYQYNPDWTEWDELAYVKSLIS